MFKKITLIFIVNFFFITLLCARTIHVPDSVSTIQAAIDSSVNGDTVLVSDGEYDLGSISIEKDIVLSSNFLVNGNSDHIYNTTINGSEVEIRSSVEFWGFILNSNITVRGTDSHKYPSFHNLIIDGNVMCTNGSSPSFTNMLFKNSKEYGYMTFEIIGQFETAENKEPILVTIINSTINGYFGNWTDDEDKMTVVVFNSIITANIMSSNLSSNLYIGYSYAWSSLGWSDYVWYGPGNIGTCYDNWSDVDCGTSNLGLEDNFRLSPGSDCIGSGTDSVEFDGKWYYALSTDLEGNPRPNPTGSNIDMGAYESEFAVSHYYAIIELDTNLVDFGDHELEEEGGVSSTKELKISNVGYKTLEMVTELSLNSPFSIDGNLDNIQPQTSDEITIRFESYEMGEHIDTLIIRSDDPKVNEVKVVLKATCIDPTSLSIDDLTKIPKEFEVYQNYPNPFNPSTRIKFALPQSEHVLLEVFNMLGQRVATLLDREMNVGYHEIEFAGSNLSSGVYFYSISAGKFKDIKKMILIR